MSSELENKLKNYTLYKMINDCIISQNLELLHRFLSEYGPTSKYDRNDFVYSLGYGNLDMNALHQLATYLKDKGAVLSLGAGIALNESILQILGIPIISTDPMISYKSGLSSDKFIPYMEVEKLTATDAIQKYVQNGNCNVLFMCWPSQLKSDNSEKQNEYDNWATNAIKQFHSLSPNGLIIYIGELENGCTATPDFFTFINSNYTIQQTITYPNWKLQTGISDLFQQMQMMMQASGLNFDQLSDEYKEMTLSMTQLLDKVYIYQRKK